MDGRNRKNIRAGIEVAVVLKRDQPTGKETRGIVRDILTRSSFHPHGIKVRLADGQVGRVKQILGQAGKSTNGGPGPSISGPRPLRPKPEPE